MKPSRKRAGSIRKLHYEDGLKTFVARILDDAISGEFLESLSALARRVALLGALNSLSQLTLKATLPGVPDFYQGTEFWDLSLVDPDNRRPVDFAMRADALSALHAPDWEKLAQSWPDGRLKLAWTAHLLKMRNDLAEVFTNGDYQPLEVSGPHRDHIIAFARRRGQKCGDRGGRPMVRALHARRTHLAQAGGVRCNRRCAGICGRRRCRRRHGVFPRHRCFRHLPVAVLKANVVNAARPVRKKAIA